MSTYTKQFFLIAIAAISHGTSTIWWNSNTISAKHTCIHGTEG